VIGNQHGASPAVSPSAAHKHLVQRRRWRWEFRCRAERLSVVCPATDVSGIFAIGGRGRWWRRARPRVGNSHKVGGGGGFGFFYGGSGGGDVLTGFGAGGFGGGGTAGVRSEIIAKEVAVVGGWWWLVSSSFCDRTCRHQLFDAVCWLWEPPQAEACFSGARDGCRGPCAIP